MKKHIILTIALSLCALSITACGKNNQDDGIKVIEANDVAESKEQKETEYEQPKVDNITNTDNTNSSQEQNENNIEQNDIGGAVSEMDPTIYGMWMSDTGSSLQFYNSSNSIQFILFDATTEESIIGDATTDNTSYIEVTYIEQVEESEQADTEEQQEGEEESEEEFINNYGSDEEFYAAMEKEQAELYQTVRYSIEKNEFDSETSTMYLTLRDGDKVYEFYTSITTLTPDYSSTDSDNAYIEENITDTETSE